MFLNAPGIRDFQERKTNFTELKNKTNITFLQETYNSSESKTPWKFQRWGGMSVLPTVLITAEVLLFYLVISLICAGG